MRRGVTVTPPCSAGGGRRFSDGVSSGAVFSAFSPLISISLIISCCRWSSPPKNAIHSGAETATAVTASRITATATATPRVIPRRSMGRSGCRRSQPQGSASNRIRSRQYRGEKSASRPSARSSTFSYWARLASISPWRNRASNCRIGVSLLLQPLFQHGSAPQDAHRHGGLLDSQPPGDLPIAPLLHALEFQHPPVALRQGPD